MTKFAKDNKIDKKKQMIKTKGRRTKKKDRNAFFSFSLSLSLSHSTYQSSYQSISLFLFKNVYLTYSPIHHQNTS